MCRLLLLLVWFLAAASPALAQFQVSTAVQFDTVSTRMVGPDMVYLRIVAPAVPWSIDVLEIDLTNPYLEVKAVKAHDLRAGGFETTTSMATRNDAPNHRVVGAINADFFGGAGEVNSIHVGDGEIVRRERPNYPAIGFDTSNRPFLSRAVAGGAVRAASGSVAISGYNEARGSNQLVLFNRYRGASTGTDGSGTEVLIRPLSDWVVNDTLLAVVEAIEMGVGNHAIPAGKAVLSGHGTAATFLQSNVQVNDTVRVYQRVTPGPALVEDMVAGNPFLIRNGVPEALDSGNFNVDRHPRTAVGFNADTTKLYFVTVDGRQSSSAGMSNFELRDFLLQMGLADALNLDGGGSTTMVVRGDIVNSPSGGAERPVGNALIAVATAPDGPLAHIQTTPTFNKLFHGRSVQLRVTGADEYYRPIDIDPSRITYSVDPPLGTVSPEGRFTAGLEAGTGYLYVTYDGLRDSVQVEVKTVGRLDVFPVVATTDTQRPISFRLQAFDTDGVEQALRPEWVSWAAADTTVGTVSTSGVFRGRAEGTTEVVATVLSDFSASATVNVELASGTVVLDPLDSTEGWTLASEGLVDMEATTLTAVDDPAAPTGRSLHLRYAFTESSAHVSYLHLNTDLPITAVPDSVNFFLRSDGANHIVRLHFEDHAGNEFAMAVPRFANDSTAYALMPGPISRLSADAVFPIRLRAIRIQLAYKDGRVAGKRYEGDLFLDNLYVSYPGYTTSVTDGPEIPERFAFLGNYPNPFTGTTTITYRASRTETVRFVLYDLLGREQALAVEHSVTPGEHSFVLDAGHLASGIYILRADTDGARPLKITVLR
jgi:hypothetical protein